MHGLCLLKSSLFLILPLKNFISFNYCAYYQSIILYFNLNIQALIIIIILQLPLKMSEYIDESTNDVSHNPFKSKKIFKKQLLLEQNSNHYSNDQVSNTIAFHNNPMLDDTQTIAIPFKLTAKTNAQTPQRIQKNKKINQAFGDILQEQTQTKKRTRTNHKFRNLKQQSIEVEFDKKFQQKQQQFLKLIAPPEAAPTKNTIQIPKPSQELNQKLKGPSLRQKFGALLPEINQQKISSQQQHLLKIMGHLDESILFCNRQRDIKAVFFEQIRRKIRDSLRIMIDIRHIQQLYFLDQNIYILKWEWSFNKKGYDLLITLPQIQSKDLRKDHTKQMIIRFLDQKHQDFLKQKSLTHTSINARWHSNFEPSRYQVPRKPLPPHPETKNAQLRTLQIEKIQSIKNNTLKELIKTQKQKTQVKSISSFSVMDMILKGKDSKQIQKNMFAVMKQKQLENQRKKKQQQQNSYRQKNEVDSDKLLQILGAIQFIYRSKNVSNFFKPLLIEKILERIKNRYSSITVQKHVDYIVELKQIGFLKQKVTNPKNPVMYQVNLKKYDSLRAHIEEMKTKQKNQQQITI